MESNFFKESTFERIVKYFFCFEPQLGKKLGHLSNFKISILLPNLSLYGKFNLNGGNPCAIP